MDVKAVAHAAQPMIHEITILIQEAEGIVRVLWVPGEITKIVVKGALAAATMASQGETVQIGAEAALAAEAVATQVIAIINLALTDLTLAVAAAVPIATAIVKVAMILHHKAITIVIGINKSQHSTVLDHMLLLAGTNNVILATLNQQHMLLLADTSKVMLAVLNHRHMPLLADPNKVMLHLEAICKSHILPTRINKRTSLLPSSHCGIAIPMKIQQFPCIRTH